MRPAPRSGRATLTDARAAATSLAFALLAPSALSSQPPVSISDSGGVRIIFIATGNPVPLHLGPPECVISTDPSGRALTSVPAAISLSRNRLLIAGATGQTLFLAECEKGARSVAPHVRAVQRLVRWRGDTILAVENARTALITDEGVFAGYWASGLLAVCALGDGDALMSGRPVFTSPGARGTMTLMRYRVTEGRSELDTVLSVLGNDVPIAVNDQSRRVGAGRVSTARLLESPFGRVTSVRCRGSTILHADGTTYEIRAYTDAGKPELLIRRAAPNRRLTPTIRKEFQGRAATQGSSGAPEEIARLGFPERIPAFRRVEVDALQRVWVEEYLVPPDSTVEWTVVDLAGSVLGAVQVPAASRILYFGADQLVLRHRRGANVRVAVHRLPAALQGSSTPPRPR